MIYTNDFQALVSQASSFIGYGNPNAKILILGKEAAIDADENQQQRLLEIDKNVEAWRKLIHGEIPEGVNPLYPYKGQKYKVEIRGHQSGGTSRTWYQYQKLLNFIRNNWDNTEIDFHEYCFSSDLSTETALCSAKANKKATRLSIEKRSQMFALPFFRSFPIVIVACGHYQRDYHIDLEGIFQVKWDRKTLKEEGFWLNIHREEGGTSPKLLIHTNQLSMVSDELIKRIAEKVKEFIVSNSITI